MLSISQTEIERRLRFDNPWWSDGGCVDSRYTELPKRFYFSHFYELVSEETLNRAVILMGPRRVGKTVMVYQTLDALLNSGVPPQNLLYVSLETPIYTGLSLEQIINLFQDLHSHKHNSELYVVFDEIQYLAQWEVHLKSLVDSYPSHKYIATGSAAAALKLKSKESGAGRFTEFLLPPLTFAEYLNFIDKESLLRHERNEYTDSWIANDITELNREFINYLNFGGYPEAVFSPVIQKDSERYIKSDIIDKVLLRDLPSLYGISDVQELNKLFNSIAYNTGNEVSLEALSKNSGVAKNTIKRYIEYLEAAFLIKIVSRVDDNGAKFKRAVSFKVYLTNPSMRAALFGPVRSDDSAMGALTETAIFSQWFHNPSITDRLHYARWKKGEVDLAYINPSVAKTEWCVEVKWSDRIVKNDSELSEAFNFCRRNKLKSIRVTTKSITTNKVIDGLSVEYEPSAEYAYVLGRNILGSFRVNGNLQPF